MSQWLRLADRGQAPRQTMKVEGKDIEVSRKAKIEMDRLRSSDMKEHNYLNYNLS